MRNSQDKKEDLVVEYINRVVFGCFTAFPRLFLTQPLETTLARLQANPSFKIKEIAKKVLDERGVKGFYDGSVPTFFRYVTMKFFGVPVMTYSYSWAKEVFSESKYSSVAPPIITSAAMAGHDWLAISYMNYKFFQQTLDTKVHYKSAADAVYGIYNSSRAIPLLQAYRWISFLSSREIWKRGCGEMSDSPAYMLGSAVFSAAAHCLAVPFLERLNNAVNKDFSNSNRSILQIAKLIYNTEGVVPIYKRAVPFVFANSTITLLLWDIILTASTKPSYDEPSR